MSDQIPPNRAPIAFTYLNARLEKAAAKLLAEYLRTPEGAAEGLPPAPEEPGRMKMIRNEHGVTAWERGDLQLILQEDKLYVVFGVLLNVRIWDGRVDFLVGAPRDLKEALLSLTDEYDAVPLAGVTAGGVA